MGYFAVLLIMDVSFIIGAILYIKVVVNGKCRHLSGCRREITRSLEYSRFLESNLGEAMEWGWIALLPLASLAVIEAMV